MSQSASANPKRLEIRKYPNRRYYDTTRSRHVTLEQIHALIRDGHEVRVVDSKTEQDITPKVLAQIIIDLDAPKLGVFPVTMLHRLLQSNQELVGGFVEKYFNQPLTSFMDSQRNMEQYFRQAMGLKPAPSPVSDWTRLMWGPFDPSFWSGGDRNGAGGVPSSPSSGAAAGSQNSGVGGSSSSGAPGATDRSNGTPSTSDTEEARELRKQIQALSRQVASLEGQLQARKSGPGARKNARRNGR